MKALNVLLAVLVSALIAAAVFEGGLRLIGKGAPTTLNAFDPVTGWRNEAGASKTTSVPDGGSVDFTFNAQGLREPGVTPDGKGDQRRLLALGDSFTLGRYTDQELVFTERLEELWGGEVEVLNTGNEAWSTDQQVAWFLEHGAAWQPDAVLILPYENDLFWCGEADYVGTAKPRFRADGTLDPGPLEDRMQKSWFEGTAIGNTFFKKRGSMPTFERNGRTYLREHGILFDDPPEFLEDARARATGALKALAARCEELGVELVVAPIPSETGIHPEARKAFEERNGFAGASWSPDNAVETFFEIAREAGIPEERLVDVRPHLLERAGAGETLYFDRDWHLNDAGNRELALALAPRLSALESLPEAAGSLGAPAAPSGGLPGWLPWYLGLWALLGTCYASVYRQVEKPALGFAKVGALLAVVFTIAVGGMHAIGLLPPQTAQVAVLGVILVILGFVAYKLGDRLGTITELLAAFVGRGHWYLMPLVTVLLTVGSLLVVAASSPLVAPFIYTLF